MKNQVKATDKDLVLTLLLGWAGYWRLKKGQKGLAVLWFFTLGCAGIGWLADIIACFSAIRRGKDSVRSTSQHSTVQHIFQPELAQVMPRDDLARALNGSKYYLNPRTMTMHWGDCRCIVGVKGMLTTTDYSAAKRSGYKECSVCMRP